MGLRIVHALNVTRSSKNYEEFVSYKSVFSLWSFRFGFFFLCKRDCFGVHSFGESGSGFLICGVP